MDCVQHIDGYQDVNFDASPAESVFNLRFRNDCTRAVVVRVSSRLTDVVYAATEAGYTLDHSRDWVDISAGNSGWLCSSRCRFPASLGEGMRFKWRACFTDESCPWPEYPAV